MSGMSFMDIMKISIVLPVLLVLSVICITVTFERWIYFLRHARVNSSMMDRVRTLVKAGNLNEAKREAMRGGRGMVTEAIAAQLDAVSLPRNERESLVLYYHQRFQNMLQKRLWVFG